MYFLVVRQKFTANVVVGLLGNESSDSNRFTLVTPKPENGVRLQATLGNQNPTGLPVRAVSAIIGGADGPTSVFVAGKLNSVLVSILLIAIGVVMLIVAIIFYFLKKK